MNGQPSLISSSDWAAEVAKASGVPVDRVTEILKEQRIPGARVLTSRAKLHIDTVHFAGVKTLREIDASVPRKREPFSFTHEFSHSVTAFATRGMNDAGKSSVINVITWGLRGRSNLQKDVRSWIDQAALQFTIGGEKILVAWTDRGGVPVGQVIVLGAAAVVGWDTLDREAGLFFGQKASISARESGDDAIDESGALTPLEAAVERLIASGSVAIASFDSDPSFEVAMNTVLMPRLGFETIEAWQKNKNASEGDDGNLVNHGWMLWSQALSITDPSVKVTLGETAVSALPLLQMYLGTTWGPSATASLARIGSIKAELASFTRRKKATDLRLKDSLTEIERQIEAVESKIAAAPVVATLEEIDEALMDAARYAAESAAANRAYLEVATELGRVSKLVQSAEADEMALAEAAITQRFWHSLKPSCCPRCDVPVDETRWRREQDGNCSLCDSPVDIAVETSNVTTMMSDEEDPDELLLARERTAALQLELLVIDAKHDELLVLKKAAEQLVTDRKADPRLAGGDPRARRELELQLATLRGRLDERRHHTIDEQEIDERTETLTVLEAALRVAKDLRDHEQREMLNDVSKRITAMGQSLGIVQLESAKLLGNTHMPVTKGGVDSPFGKLTDGEKLRLKIALVIALLHVGTAAGVGRHPGVLLIDSLAREELNPNNAKTLLAELSKVAQENQLQIITSSAHGDLVEAALPAGATRLSNSEDLMW